MDALKGVGILVACPCSIPQNPDYPLKLLKIVINHCFQFFHFGRKLQLNLRINHSVTVSPQKMQTGSGTNYHSFHFILGRVKDLRF